jgi:hypothetical protein
MMDREQIEIVCGVIAAVLFALSEALALSKSSDCNSVAQLLGNAARCLRRNQAEEEEEEEEEEAV